MIMSCWSRVGLSKRGNLDVDTRTEGECHVNTEGEITEGEREIRVICLWAKGHPRLSVTRRSQRRERGIFSLTALRRSQFCWHFDLGLLVAGTVRRSCFVNPSHPVYGTLLGQP